MAGLILNRRIDAYHHPDNRQGTYSTSERAAMFEDMAEVGRGCHQLNETVSRRGEVLRDDGWVVVSADSTPYVHVPRTCALA